MRRRAPAVPPAGVSSPIKVLFVVSEAEPFAKTGGLADVAAALPKALAALGHDVRLVLPLYRQVDRTRHGVRPTDMRVAVPMGRTVREGRVWEAVLPGSRVRTYLIDQAAFFDRSGLYQEDGRDYADNLERFSFFSQATLQLLGRLRWQPEILHCHDWQAALACAHLAWGPPSSDARFARMRTVLTVHNLAYQGLFPKSQWPLTGLPDGAFDIDGLEFHQQGSCLKGGLVSAARLTTVSPTYAREAQTEKFGCGLDGLLRLRARELTGILNGIDTEAWNPQTDPHIAARYSAARLSGKAACKRALQRQQRLPQREELLIGMVQRLAEQKGIDLFLDAAQALLALPVQVVLLGTGDAAYHRRLEALARRFPERLSVNLVFDDALAHQIEAGADAFLMPSRFEPCGLSQMYSMRYGTVPIVRPVGGLADTVVEVETAERPATGFVMQEHAAQALVEAVRRAVNAFGDHRRWRALMRAGMRQDASWGRSARAYVDVYRQALQRR